MNRWTVLLLVVALAFTAAIGCSSGGVSPVAPTTTPSLTADSVDPGQAQNHLWGYWDLYFDFEAQTVEAVPNHHADFAANVVSFLNSNGGLAFGINEVLVDTTWIDVDIDVSMTHPLAGLPQYDGYDVRGIFVGNGSQGLAYGTGLDASDMATDQYMMDDPDDLVGGADGYTRWFNPGEFTIPGVLGYTPGAFATPGYTGDATLNPYKYFADGLGAEDDVWEFLNATLDQGVFSSGATNTRNYYIRFPNPVPGVAYGYAVCASWQGEDPTDHPANATEALAVSVSITDSLYYVDGVENGGEFIAELDVFDWGSAPNSVGVMEDYVIYIESDVLSTPYMFDSVDMTPVDGSATYSTYECEIPADNLSGNTGDIGYAEYWVIVEYPNADYKYPDDPTIPAPNGDLAAFFRFNDLYINFEPYNEPPICDLQVVTTMPVEGWGPVPVEFDASGSTDPDLDPLTYSWDFDGDGTFGDAYDTGTDDNPTKLYDEDYVGAVSVRLDDGQGHEVDCSVDVDITAYGLKNIDLRSGVTALDLAACESDGDLYVLYSDGQVWRYTIGGYYRDGALFYTTSTLASYIDASPNGDSVVGGRRTGPDYSRSYYASGAAAGDHSGSCYYWVAGVNCSHGGSSNNQHGVWCAYVFQTVYWRFSPSTYGGGSGYIVNEGSGTSYVNHNYIRGMEPDTSGYIFCVEGSPENRVERRHYYFYTYTGPSWAVTDPLDITRNATTTIYVLSNNAGGDHIEKYSNTGAAQGTYGDAQSIPYPPLRIEGTEHSSNYVFVLYGDGTNGYFISIFDQSEL